VVTSSNSTTRNFINAMYAPMTERGEPLCEPCPNKREGIIGRICKATLQGYDH
jgi:hypothetical protein